MSVLWPQQTVVVIGATGSWGQECVRQLLALGAHKIIVFSRDEWKQAQMERHYQNEHVLRFYLGDIRDPARCQEIISPEVTAVIHLAALKQIGRGERDPFEFVQTNVFGSMNIAKAVLRAKVERALFVSSDKAVLPTTLYGMSKACAERVWLGANVFSPAPHPPHFSIARFGNALASRGSVLTIWQQQKARGLPLTVTDPGMTRFLITLPEAVRFVLASVARMEGDEEFIPPMPTVTIGDLCRAFVADQPDYPIEVVGSRVYGEKYHEVLEPEGASSADTQAWQRLSVPEIRAILESAEAYTHAPPPGGASARLSE